MRRSSNPPISITTTAPFHSTHFKPFTRFTLPDNPTTYEGYVGVEWQLTNCGGKQRSCESTHGAGQENLASILGKGSHVSLPHCSDRLRDALYSSVGTATGYRPECWIPSARMVLPSQLSRQALGRSLQLSPYSGGLQAGMLESQHKNATLKCPDRIGDPQPRSVWVQAEISQGKKRTGRKANLYLQPGSRNE
jgi:hypothetical protein